MIDDREFDRLLEEELGELPLSQDTVEQTTPWKRAMNQVLIGLAMTTITFRFWNLDHILPATGTLLIYLGFRTLRRENGWLRACWLISALQLVRDYLTLVANATIWGSELDFTFWNYLLLPVSLFQLFCLWQGIKEVRRRAGQPPEAPAAGALLAAYCVLCALGLLQIDGLLIVLPYGACYLFILNRMFKVPALLDGAGYQVESAPTRIPERMAWIGWTVLLLLSILAAGLLFGRYPMEWTPKDDLQTPQLEAIRTNLLELGMPEYVAADLAPADLEKLEGALSVTFDVWEEPFNEGREVSTTVGNHTTISTVYDVKEFRATDICVELPDDQWRIIHHFLWQEDPGLRTTECILLWLVDQGNKSQYYRVDPELTGRLLYDWEGTTYTGDYYRIETKTYTTDDVFFGRSVNTHPFATFSLPLRGEDCRGYLTYGFEMIREGCIIDGWSNYTHQTNRFAYPLMTAAQHEMAGIWNGMGDFHTAQTAIQLYPGDERKENNSFPTLFEQTQD